MFRMLLIACALLAAVTVQAEDAPEAEPPSEHAEVPEERKAEQARQRALEFNEQAAEHFARGDFARAEYFAKRALDMQAENREALTWLRKIEAERAGAPDRPGILPPTPELAQDERGRAKAWIAVLYGPNQVQREIARRELLGLGLAARPLLESVAASGSEHAAPIAKDLLAHPVMDPASPRVRLVLERGAIEATLFEDAAPNTVANFLSLAGEGFYNGLSFHRVIEQFMIQAGKPAKSGQDGPGYFIRDEIDATALNLDKRTAKDLTERMGREAPPAETAAKPLKEIYEQQGYRYLDNLPSRPVTRGSLAMANLNRPDTNGSQFFIAQIDCPWLDGRHTVFGHVTKGMDLVQSMRPGETILRIEILHKRDHPYTVQKLEP